MTIRYYKTDNISYMYDGFVLVYNGVKIHRRQTQGQNICRNGSHFFFLEKITALTCYSRSKKRKEGFNLLQENLYSTSHLGVWSRATFVSVLLAEKNITKEICLIQSRFSKCVQTNDVKLKVKSTLIRIEMNT